MDPIILILLVVAAVKFVIIGVLLFVVFRDDIKQYIAEKTRKKKPSTVPTCMYCRSTWTEAVDDGKPQWDDQDLVLVTTYMCLHCHLPFWHVERVRTGSLRH